MADYCFTPDSDGDALYTLARMSHSQLAFVTAIAGKECGSIQFAID